MATINYITYDSWWDTDKTILEGLIKDNTVNVFVVNFDIDKNKFQNKKNQGFNTFYQHTQKFRDRDLRSIFTALFLFRSVKKYITMDSLNIFVPGQNLFLLFLMLLLPKKTTCICLHNYIEHIDTRNSIFVYIKRLFYLRFQKFIFYSQGQQDAFIKDHPTKRAFLLNMPLKDYGRTFNVRSKNQIRFLFFGYIRDYKRLDLFIEAANLVSNKKAIFVIAGNTDKSEKYISQIKNKSRFDLHFGFIKDEEIAHLFESSDFLVLPYEDSTQSGPSLIALNYSLPIIASDLPSFRVLVDNRKNGFLFESGNAQSLAIVMDEVCNLRDEELRKISECQDLKRKEYLEKSDVEAFFSLYYKELMT